MSSPAKTRAVKLTLSLLVMIPIISLGLPAAVVDDFLEWTYEPRHSLGDRAEPPIPADFVIQLVLDDDASEGDFGVGGATAQQFLWFNRFTPASGLVRLDQIWVLFPPGPNMAVGAPVELVVYQDEDGDPSNGAFLVASFDVAIQFVDGNTFSIYDVDPPLWFMPPQDVLIGVVDRFVVSGVTTTTRPAALDTTVSQGRSWLAVWSGDPPSPPVLPADSLNSTVDAFVPGNWMIRAFGRHHLAPGVPALNPVGLMLLCLLTVAAGVFLLMRGGGPGLHQ